MNPRPFKPRGRPTRRKETPKPEPRRLPDPGALDAKLGPDEEAALQQALAPLVSPDDVMEVAARFRTYLVGLVGWNVRSNLVSAGDHGRLVRRHVVESLACVPLLDELGGSTLIDLGSGGGFPGIPIKLVRPALEVALVESRRMKSLFLQRALDGLRLRGAVAWQTRIETLAELPADPHPGALSAGLGGSAVRHEGPATRPLVDLVTSRAVAALDKTCGWVAPLVRPGGHLVTFKGSRVDEELGGWEARPGPWALARVEREVVPGLTLVALRKTEGSES